MLTLEREPGSLVVHEGATGERGALVFGPLRLATIERLDGFKRLPPGTYDLEMAHVTFQSGKKSRALRVLGEYSGGRIYIHVANYPGQLEGCIAVGLSETQRGVARSARAMRQLLDALGGWGPGRRTQLLILGW